MPLFGIRVLAGEESPTGAAAAGFQRGAAQTMGMFAEASKQREQRRQFDALTPYREAQSRVQQALASKLEGVLQGEIEATNARNAAVPVQTELQTDLLANQVAGGQLSNEVTAYQLAEQQALEPQRRLVAQAEAYQAELSARQAQVAYDEFTSPEATRIRSYTRDATARLLGQQLESAQTQEKIAKSKLDAETFAFQRMKAEAMAQDVSNEAYADGFGAIASTLPDELVAAVQRIFDADDPDMTPSMKGAAAKQVVSDYFEQKSFQYARNATVNMRTLQRKMAQMPQLLQDADFSRGLTALGQAQRQGQYGMAAALTQSLVASADAIEFSITKQAQGLGLIATTQEMFGSLGVGALNNNRLPAELKDRAQMAPSQWLDIQQSELEDLAEDRLTQSEWHRWVLQTLDPLDLSQNQELLMVKVESQQWVIDNMRQAEALSRLPASTPSNAADPSGVNRADDLGSAFDAVNILGGSQ